MNRKLRKAAGALILFLLAAEEFVLIASDAGVRTALEVYLTVMAMLVIVALIILAAWLLSD